jgi:hypothetical protein
MCETFSFVGDDEKKVYKTNKRIAMKKPKVLLECNDKCGTNCEKIKKQNAEFRNKFEREIKVLKHLGNKSYLLNYYRSP